MGTSIKLLCKISMTLLARIRKIKLWTDHGSLELGSVSPLTPRFFVCQQCELGSKLWIVVNIHVYFLNTGKCICKIKVIIPPTPQDYYEILMRQTIHVEDSGQYLAPSKISVNINSLLPPISPPSPLEAQPTVFYYPLSCEKHASKLIHPFLW